MRVSARGYNRDSGSRAIFDEEITEAVVEEDGKSEVKINTLYLKKSKADGSMTMRIGPRALSGFGGKYHLYVHLTEDEIAKLFLECFPQVRDVIARVMPPPPPTGLQSTVSATPEEPEPIDIFKFVRP